MAFTFKFNNNSMDVIMSIVRKYDVNPSEAVDMIIASPELIKESNDGREERGDEITSN
jgi:hypothetical protein